MAHSRHPVVFSHANPLALADHGRNITDEQIRACAATGGVVCVSGVSRFLGTETPTAPDIARHVAYVADLVGTGPVGLGLDIGFSEPGLNDDPPGACDPGCGASDRAAPRLGFGIVLFGMQIAGASAKLPAAHPAAIDQIGPGIPAVCILGGIGTAGGFEFYLQAREDDDLPPWMEETAAAQAHQRALEPPRQLHRVQLAQLRRQRRQRHLAQAALVVAPGKAHQLPPTGRQRGQGGEHLGDGAGGEVGAGVQRGAVPHHAQHLAFAQRHAHQRARRQRPVAAVGEEVAHPAVGRGGHDDGGPDNHA
mgnify:CR=1 FL=1